MESNNELQHHGVLGMKWGVRRQQNKSRSSSRSSKRSAISEDASTAYQLKKKRVSEMSNAELRKLNERQQLERTYASMNPSTLKKAMKIISTVTVTTGTFLTAYSNSEKLVKGGKTVANRIVDSIGDWVVKGIK